MLEIITQPTQVHIFATVTGRLWWPQDQVEFETHRTFTYKPRERFITSDQTTDLRDALLRMQDSGDYQNLSFVGEVEVIAERTQVFVDAVTRRVVKEITRKRTLTISEDHPDYSDLW